MMRFRFVLLASLLTVASPLAAADVGVGPSAPANLVAVAGPGVGAISLTWNSSQSLVGVSSYNVYRFAPNGSRELVGSTNASTTTFVDAGLPNGATETYVVTAADLTGEGPASANATATTFAAPSAPQHVVATAGDLGTVGEARVSWAAPASDGGSPVVAYYVYRDGAVVASVDASASSWTDEGLDVTSAHHYAVSAVNLVGEGAQSDVACSMASPWGALPATMC